MPPLTIHGPAELRIVDDSTATIEVQSRLIAEGTGNDSIKIVSAAAIPGPGKWYGICQTAGTLKLDHTSINHAYRGLWIDNTDDSVCCVVDSSAIDNVTFAGVTIHAKVNSDIQVRNSRISGFGWYGVEVKEGAPEIDGCTFTGNGRKGVYLDGAYQSKPCRGHVWNCRFENMEYTSASGVYAYGMRNWADDNSYEWQSDTLLKNNVFVTDDYYGKTSQVGYYICNVFDTIQMHMNAVWGENNRPGYGILSYSTHNFISGNTAAAESLSMIRGPNYGIYCFSSSNTDSNYPTIRRVSIAPNTSNTGYSVWLNSCGRADVGNGDEDGMNVLNADCYSKAPITTYGVYNNNWYVTAPAIGNYWNTEVCKHGLVDTWSALGTNPFNGGGAKRAVPAADAPAVARQRLEVPQPYPNPFNASATIRFSLAVSQKINVTIYNILGQRVRTLWDGVAEAGEHSIEWDGHDGAGRILASGVYLYRVTTDDNQMTKSIVLVK